MKQGKKKYSRLLSLLLAFVMVFTMMPGMAWAETGNTAATATVYLTVSNQGVLAADNNGSVMANRPVTVTDLNSDGSFTVDEALKAAHSTYNTESGYGTTTQSYMTAVNKLWGVETSNVLFFVNSAGLEMSVDWSYVKDGDHIVASVNSDAVYSDWYTYFDSETKGVSVGEELILNLKGFKGMATADWAKESSPLHGIQIGTYTDGQFAAVNGAVTDASGNVTLTFDKAGTYIVSAQGPVQNVKTEKSLNLTRYSALVSGKTLYGTGSATNPQLAYTATDYGNGPYPTSEIEYVEFKSWEEAQQAYNLVKSNDGYEIKDCPIIAPVCVVTVTNEAPDATVYMTVNNKGVIAETSDGSPMADCEVTVSDINKDGVLTYHEALIAAHKEYKSENDYMATDGQWGLSVSKLWGVETTNTLYYKNGSKLASNVGDTLTSTVSEGDYLYASINADNTYYADRYASFDVNTKKVAAGEEFNLTLNVGTTDTTVYENIKVGTWVDGTFSEIDSKAFGTDGKITLSFAESGTYYVTANGTVNDSTPDYTAQPDSDWNYPTIKHDCPIMAPICTVTVTSTDLSVLAFTSKSADITATFDMYPEFSEDVKEYTLYVPYAASSIYTWAKLADDAEGSIAIKYVKYNATDGAVSTHTVTSGASSGKSPSNVLKYESFTGNTLDITVGGTSAYKVNIVRVGSLKSLTVKAGPEGEETSVTLSPSFNKTKYEYVASRKIGADDKVIFTSTLYEGSELTLNGEIYTSKTAITPSWDNNRKYTAELKVQAAGNTDPKAAGKYTIVFSQQAQSISVTTPPTKTEYAFGESFDPAGMVVTATYKDGGTAIVDPADISFEPSKPLTTETKVTISYEGLTTEQAVTVAGSAFEGEGTEGNPYLIKTVDDMVALSDYVADGVDFAGKYIKMVNDITLPDKAGDDAWVPLGISTAKPFSGTFDGNNKTLTIPEGGLPLFGTVKNGAIKNLNVYGKKIAGYGLVNNYTTINDTTIVIENVTLKSGSQTLQSGFIGGYASGSDQITIRNCTVEENVIIGYDKAQKWIGSFGGEFNGTIENCVSYADVYGTDFVGGIISNKGQSMGDFIVKNCEFYGTVTATGNYAGGIVGHGYGGSGWGFTGNSPAVTIQNCLVDATVTGANYVGGILGGDVGVYQTWDNGIGYIQDNVFYGTVKATTSNGYAGGIIGYLASLNKHNIIENNYFIDSCGTSEGIGYIYLVDTNCETHETESGTTYFDTSVSTTGYPKDYYTSVRKNHNRTDDPLGADADTLTKAMTAAQFKDGTVTEMLNLSESSAHNWIQGADYPVHSNDPIFYKLTVSDGYVKDYYIGDTFSFGNAVITAYKSDDTTKILSASEVRITGFDSTARGQKTVTVAYGTAKAELIVVVLEKVNENQKNEITVNLRIVGDTDHGDDGQIHTMATGGLTTWISKSYTLEKNSTVEDLLKMADEEDSSLTIHGTWNGQYGTSYIEGVSYNGTTLYEFTNGNFSGWKYSVNGKYPEIGVSAYYLNNGDSVVFHYTDDYTKESDAKEMTGGSVVGEEKNEVTTEKESGTETNTTTTPTEVTVVGTTATATITKENVTETLKQATENKASEIVLQVSSGDTKGAANIKVQLDTTTVKDIAGKTEAALTVKTENATVTLDRETLKTVAAEAAGSTVTLEVIEVAAPTAAHKEAAGANGHVIQLVIKSGTKTISLFNEGKATVTVEIPSKLTGKKVAAIHIADDGTTEHLKGEEVTVGGKKHYRFETPHFSTFALVDADEVGLEVEETSAMTADEVKTLIADLSPAARSAKVAKGVKVTLKLDAADRAIIEQIEAAGYTVKYKFYRSTKKTSKYQAKLTSKKSSYTNTGGKKGTKYYYKARVQVYDAEGKLIARTELKQCKYACRKWTK